MTKNDVIRLEITSVANDGSGVGRYEGAAVFVPFSAVGDILDCRVLKVLKNRAYAKIERIVSPSPDRIPMDSTPGSPVWRMPFIFSGGK